MIVLPTYEQNQQAWMIAQLLQKELDAGTIKEIADLEGRMELEVAAELFTDLTGMKGWPNEAV